MNINEKDNIIIYNNFFIKKHKIVLDKKNKYETMKLVFSNKLLNIEKKEYEIELAKRIKNFLVTMSNKCSNFNPNLYMHNIKKTNFNIQNLEEYKIGKIGGEVLISGINNLTIRNFDSMEHELMHLATIKKDVYNYSGFNAYIEGYTELLTNRYFNNEKPEKSYLFESIFAKNVETILGKDYMEKKFFEGNLLETMKKLYKYSSEQKIKNMFYNLSCISNEFLNNNFRFNEKYVQKCWDEIYEVLLECLINKCIEVNDTKKTKKIIEEGIWFGYQKFRVISHSEYKTIYNLRDEQLDETFAKIYNIKETKNKRN